MKSIIIVAISLVALFLQGSVVQAAPVELVSKPFQSRPSTFGDSGDLEINGDAKWAIFTSSGTGITTNAVEEFILNVFLKNIETGEITLLSQGPAPDRNAGNGHSFGATITADGQFVVFETESDNLIEDDANEASDVVLFNRTTGTLSLVSGTTNGVAEGSSGAATITSNGRFILFESDATDLSPLDSNDWVDLYLLNRESGEIQLVTVNSNGTAAAHTSFPQFALGTYAAAASGDGRYVAFISSGTNHVPGVSSPSSSQVYLRDMVNGTNLWLSRTTNGAASTFVSSPAVSSNGTIVAFLSANLEGTPSPAGADGFLYLYYPELARRRAVLDGSGNKRIVNEFSLSENGGFIAYSSTNQVYLYNINSDTTRLVSAAPNGEPASGVSASPQISDDGRYLIFSSTATNLVSGVTTEVFQTYRFDAQNGEIALLSRDAGNSGASSDTHFPVVSGNGAVAGFMSYASNLVTNDNPGLNDVFVVSTSGTNAVVLVSTPHPAAISSTPTGSSTIEGQTLSADGRKLVFTSIAENIVTNDVNGTRDVFLSDLPSGITRLISLGTNGEQLPGPSSVIGMSRDGNVIAFASSNVVNGTNVRSILIHNATAVTSKIGNVLPNGDISSTVGDAALSQDGRYLAFRPATQGAINVRDLESETTVTVTIPTVPSPIQILGFSPGGKYLVARGPSPSYSLVNWRSNTVALSISSSSSGYLTNAFSADDSLFIAPVRLSGPAAETLQLYKLDTGTNATPVATNILTAAISADGSTVAYQSRTNALVSEFSLFLYDVNSGTNSPMQIDGTNPVFRVRGPISLSADGRFAAFTTTNALTGALVAGDFMDIFVYDRVLKTTTLVSERLNPAERFGGASGPLLSADGRVLAFDSSAADFVANDRNFSGDVFLRRFVAVDSDNDGLEDGWEILQFGSLNVTADADTDNDGISNRDEFRAGTDPNSAASKFVVSTDVNSENASLLLTTPATTGRTYQLQHRATLDAGDWQDVGSAQVAFSDEVTFEVPMTLQGNGFFRINAIE